MQVEPGAFHIQYDPLLLAQWLLAQLGGGRQRLQAGVQGLTPFVDGARLLALSHGVAACNTLERLRGLIERGVIDTQDGAAFDEAYQFIQLTRLHQHQLQARAEQDFSNRLDPDELNHLDRRILRESFRQAQRLQSSLALRYQL